jgi:hypothetical protein
LDVHPKRRVAAWIGGVLACIVLIGAGIAYIVIGINGRDEVKHTVSRELIFGTPDMTPDAIAASLEEAGLKDVQDVPTCSIANEQVTNGTEAKCFAGYMRMHALESSGGLTYAQMGRFQLASDPSDPKGTSDEKLAAKDDSGKPIANGPRNTWVTETALATGLNMAFFAEQVSLFAIVVGIIVVVVGIGLGVLTIYVFGWAPWRHEAAAEPTAAT